MAGIGMTVSFRPAKREQIPLLLGVAGGTGSGKTMSALRMARGIAQGGPFAFIDTENGRGLHYADAFPEMQHGDLRAPFRPERYTLAIVDGFNHLQDIPKERRVVVVDSFSHEWAGDGGCLDWKDELTGGDEKRSPQAWAKVIPAHKKMMTQLLQMEAHIILCLRAEEKMDIVRENGQIKFVPKRTLPGGSLDGWAPITHKNAPFEMTASFLLMADAPGVPRPLKLEEQHKPFVPLNQPLSEETGRQLAAWAAGSSGEPNAQASGHEQPAQATEGAPNAPTSDVPPAASGGEPASPDDILSLATRLIDGSSDPGAAAAAIEKHAGSHTPEEHLAWLRAQEQRLVTA
jgi:hypothetical protein